MTCSRREILKAIPAAAAVAASSAVPAAAIPPIARGGKTRLRLGLAAYSMRDHLTGKLQPAMDLHGFVEKAAEWEVDAVELGRVVRLLKDGGYRGYVTLEYEAAEPPLTAIPRHLATLRGLL